MARGLYEIYKNRARGRGFYKSDINPSAHVITIIIIISSHTAHAHMT